MTVAVNGDADLETAETFFVNLTNAVGATITDSQGLGTITNDDHSAVSVSDASVAEGHDGTTNLTFTVSLDLPSTGTVMVDFATASGTAAAGNDFVATSGTLTFAPGVSQMPINVNTLADLTIEPDETFTVNLSAPTNATLSDEDMSINFAEHANPSDRVAVVVTAPLTTNEHWTALRPGELKVFVDGAPRLLPAHP